MFLDLQSVYCIPLDCRWGHGLCVFAHGQLAQACKRIHAHRVLLPDYLPGSFKEGTWRVRARLRHLHHHRAPREGLLQLLVRFGASHFQQLGFDLLECPLWQAGKFQPNDGDIRRFLVFSLLRGLRTHLQRKTWLLFLLRRSLHGFNSFQYVLLMAKLLSERRCW